MGRLRSSGKAAPWIKEMKRLDREAYGFGRMSFPFIWRGHRVYLAKNEARISREDRLKFHFALHCNKCKEKKVVRGHLPPECDDWNYRAATAKLIALGYYNTECSP